MFTFKTLPPLSLYIHIPWCVRKCPYCDFNSHEKKDTLPERAYTAALLADLEKDLPRIWGRPINSIFFGGGTPSLFSPDTIDQLLSDIRARLTLKPNCEVTLEANPGTVEIEKFKGFHQAGINRLSIGIQSFNDDALKRLGRIHGAKEAIVAVESAHQAGFDNFNLDLMFGLPEQTLEQALADIDTALRLQPTHISHYQLTLEPNTWFAKHPPPLPIDDTIWTMQEACQEQLAIHGFQHYEVSAYAKPNYQCRHNLNYWQFGDYLGIGAGAHSKITDAQQQRIFRRWKIKSPKDYLHNPDPIDGESILTRADAGLEFMMNAMRLKEGVPASLFQEYTGLPIATIEKPLREAEAKQLLEWTIHHIRPTALGQRYLNNLLELFMP